MISQTADQVPNHDGAHVAAGPIAVSNALLGDSSASTGPVAFTTGASIPLSLWITNTAIDPDTLTSISTSAGDVTISGDAVVPAQGALEIGGDSQVSATITSATQDVRYGFAITVDLYFEKAGKVSLQVPVTIPAEREADRGATSILHGEKDTIWGHPGAENG